VKEGEVVVKDEEAVVMEGVGGGVVKEEAVEEMVGLCINQGCKCLH